MAPLSFFGVFDKYYNDGYSLHGGGDQGNPNKVSIKVAPYSASTKQSMRPFTLKKEQTTNQVFQKLTVQA